MTVDIAARKFQHPRVSAGALSRYPDGSRLSLRPILTKSWDVLSLGASPLIILAIWEGLCRTGLFSPEILVPPSAVLATAQDMINSGDLQHNLAASLSRLAIGYGLGTLVGIVLGAAMGLSRNVEAFIGPTFHILRQLPTLILIPAFVMFLGVGETVIIVLIAKATALPVALSVFEGIRGIPRSYRDVAAVFNVRGWQGFRWVILPAIVPTLLTGMRISLSRSWMILVATELLVAQDGLGQMMEWGRQMFRIDIVIVGIILTAVLGYGLDRIFRLAEHRLSAWQYR